MSSSLGDYERPLFAPVELVKDQSVLKGQAIAAMLVVGHPLYYWAWTRLDPQPYESLPWRLIAAALGLLALFCVWRLGARDRRSAWAFGMATAFGSVVLASWFYVANGGSAVWLASLGVMTMLYFMLTDWRIATLVTAASWGGSYVLVPALGVGVWQSSGDHPVFDQTALLILGFTLGVSVLTRYTDMSMRAVRMRSQLRALGITAHEVRTPLAGMQLLSSFMQERLSALTPEEITPEVLADLRSVATDLVQSCVDASASISTHLANANPFKPFERRSLVSLAAAAREAIARFQRASGARDPLVHLSVPRDFCVMADPGVLQQMLVNLLNNSLKAVVLRHHSAAPGQIFISIDFENQGGRLTVADRGCGIKRSELSKIFEPFFTGDPQLGHGLGLTFVQSVVTAYGGTIDVQSAEGEGTNMTIAFPEAKLL